MATVLSGLSGTFHYKPGGTVAAFGPTEIVPASRPLVTLAGEQILTLSGEEIFTGFSTGSGNLGFYANSIINIGSGFNFKPGDPVMFRIRNVQSGGIGSGVLPSPLSPFSQYYVASYNTISGFLIIAQNPGLSQIIDLSDNGLAAQPNKFEVYYSSFSAVSEIRSWTLELSRAEIDTTAIGRSLGQFFSSRSYIAGFGDASGTATVYMTDSDAELSNRMIQDVMLRRQTGAAMRLYVDYIEVNGVVDDASSRSIEIEAALTSASLNINPDDGQAVDIAFRPSGLIDFDL